MLHRAIALTCCHRAWLPCAACMQGSEFRNSLHLEDTAVDVPLTAQEGWGMSGGYAVVRGRGCQAELPACAAVARQPPARRAARAHTALARVHCCRAR